MPEQNAYLLGVDGGGSKTWAVIGDETGRVLGIGRAGGSNHQGQGLEEAMWQVNSAACQALDLAGLDASQMDAAYFCLAGADLREDFEMLRPALEELHLAPQSGLHNDSFASLRAGTDNPNAVVVGLGAGFNAMGHNAAGQEIRLPALGWESGDWGGGGELGREAIFFTIRAHDGRGEPTMLHDLVLEAFGVPNADELVRALYNARNRETWAKIHNLAPLVFKAANAGDKVARELLIRQGSEVVTTAVALLRRLEILDVPADVVLGGSVYKGEGPLLLATIRQGLRERAPQARPVVPTLEPVVGAMFCAMDLVGAPVDGAVRARAEESYGQVAGRAPAEVRST